MERTLLSAAFDFELDSELELDFDPDSEAGNRGQAPRGDGIRTLRVGTQRYSIALPTPWGRHSSGFFRTARLTKVLPPEAFSR